MDETSETIHLTFQQNNTNQLSSANSSSSIQLKSNPIVKDLSEWNLYVQSITLTTAEVALMNIRRNIEWNDVNFDYNRTNFSISLVFGVNPATGAQRYPFDFNIDNDNLLRRAGAEDPANPGFYSGCTAYIQFLSENANPAQYPNPNTNGIAITNTSNYPRSYFNIHSVQHLCDLVNNALIRITNKTVVQPAPPAPPIPPLITAPYITFDSFSQTYKFNAKIDDFIYFPGAPAPAIQTKQQVLFLYMNGFLERIFDSFRFQYYKDSVNSSDPTLTKNQILSDGLDYGLVFSNQILYNQATATQIEYQGEYNCVANMIDVHSVLVSSDGGDLLACSAEVLPLTNDQKDIGSLTLPSKAVIKNLDIDYTSLEFSGALNNTYIQFEAQNLDKAINIYSKNKLQDIRLNFEIMTMNNETYPVRIPAGGGIAQIKLILKKKSKKLQ
jgi:hypothetical protein